MNEIINAELIENTYLFCMKRVSDTEQAKDLSHDIICAALTALSKNKDIEDFYAWYWRMARNKYADFIRRKINPELPLECAGGVVSDHTDPAQMLINAEDLSTLNFALSRLAAVQREIIIRFYLKEQRAEQIARELDIPVGTVKYRLFDARKNIKERFDNMDNYGKSSYAPSEVTWFCGYAAGNASTEMTSRIAQQVMVICGSKAVSINDIADEIGVAPVYLEQVLEKMESVSLIKKQGKDKFTSNHCVFPMQAYNNAKYEAYRVFREGGFGERITNALIGLKDEIISLAFYGSDFDYSYLMWILYVYAADIFGTLGTEKYIGKYKDTYPDEKERSYRLTVMYTLPDEEINCHDIKAAAWSNLHQTFDTPNILEYINDFEMFPFPHDGSGFDDIGRDTWVDAANITLLEALSENPEKPLTGYEEEQAAKFIERGLIEKNGNRLKVNMPIIDSDVFEKILLLIKNAVRNDAEDFSQKVGKGVEDILLPYVRKDLMSSFIHWDMRMFFQPTGYLFHYGMYDTDTLKKPDDYDCSAAGLWIKRTYRK